MRRFFAELNHFMTVLEYRHIDNVNRAKGKQMAEDERVGGTSLTEPDPCPLALDWPNETAYDGWTRDELIEEILTLIGERDFAYSHVDSWKGLLKAVRVERDDLRTQLAQRDASIVRLTKRLSEEEG